MAGTIGHVLIPAAGESARFAAAGYRGPKAALEITLDGVRQRMIDHVVSRLPQGMRPVLVVRREHAEALSGYDHVVLDGPTCGQSETVLRGLRAISPSQPVMVHNCDVLIDSATLMHMTHCVAATIALHHDLSTTEPPPYSYVDTPRYPSRYAEKVRISDWAVSGAWCFPFPALLNVACDQQVRNLVPGEEAFLSGALQDIRLLGCGCIFTDLGTPEAIAAAGGVIHQ